MYKLVGVNHYDFKDSKTGEVIVGNNVHVINDTPEQQDFLGSETVKFSFSDEKLNRFLAGKPAQQLINKPVQVIYNRYGKVSELIQVGQW